MESEGFKNCIKKLEELEKKNLVKYVVLDQNYVIENLVKELLGPSVQIFHDPGHILKNLKTRLLEIFGKGREYGNFVNRIHRWFIYCLKKI